MNDLSQAPEPPQGALSAVQEYLYTRQQRRWLFPRAALVGLVAGGVAVAFRAALVEGERLRTMLLAWSHHVAFLGWLVPILLSALGASLAVILVRRFSPEAAGSGIPHLEAVLRQHRTMDGKRVLPVKFLGGVLALGSGLALGREGPTVQMGAAVADLLAKPLKLSSRDRLTLLATGAGAGLAAAFNAPLAGLIFVMEEIQGDFRPVLFGAAFIAAAVADIVTRFASGPYPVLSVPSYPIPQLSALPIFLILGLLAGIIGVGFNRALLFGLSKAQHLPKALTPYFAALVGGGIGLIGWFVPKFIGSSHGLFEEVLKGQTALALIPLWFVVRFLLTITSYATGAPGGIFAPLLILGALLGLAVGRIAHLLVPGILPEPGVCAVIGMAALFTAIVRAPLTGVVLILEMTGNYNQMLPVLVACFGAYACAELLNDRPIYEALLERDLARGGVVPPLKQARVVEVEVEPGSPFEGREVRDLGLPPGCILVHFRQGREETVPAADTRLEAHLWITAMISAETPEGIHILQQGCKAVRL